jgi:hypothetical protein
MSTPTHYTGLDCAHCTLTCSTPKMWFDVTLWPTTPGVVITPWMFVPSTSSWKVPLPCVLSRQTHTHMRYVNINIYTRTHIHTYRVADESVSHVQEATHEHTRTHTYIYIYMHTRTHTHTTSLMTARPTSGRPHTSTLGSICFTLSSSNMMPAVVGLGSFCAFAEAVCVW